MRITHRAMVDNLNKYMADNLEKLNSIQKKVATGKTFSHVSENPALATSVFGLRLSNKSIESYIETSQTSSQWMSVADVSLEQIVQLNSGAIDLALEGISETEGQAERESMATEMDAMINLGLDIGNTSLNGDYMFSGFKLNTKPFEIDTSGATDLVQYNGDNGQMNRTVGTGQQITINFDSNAALSPIIQAMITTRDALRANDTDAIKVGLTELQASLEGINTTRTTNAGVQRQLNTSIERLEGTRTEIANLISMKEDIDMGEAITYLRNQETVYQAVMEVSRRAVAVTNLFEYLR